LTEDVQDLVDKRANCQSRWRADGDDLDGTICFSFTLAFFWRFSLPR
jgi:hypothetical protein